MYMYMYIFVYSVILIELVIKNVNESSSKGFCFYRECFFIGNHFHVPAFW